MTVQNGRATGYVLVGKGTGKAPFVPKSERVQTEDQIQQVVLKLRDDGVLATAGRATDRPAPRSADLDAFEARLKGLTDLQGEAQTNLTRAAADLERLRADRTALAAELEGLKGEVETLGRTRTGLTQEIAAARTELDRVRADRTSLATEVGALSTQLQDLRTLRNDTLSAVAETRAQLAEMRGLQESVSRDVERARAEIARVQAEASRPPAAFAPVETLVANPRAIEALRAQGVGTVGALANLTPEQETALIRSQAVSRAELGQLVERSKRQIER
jgi:chromosome segregation ATPase